MSKLTNQSGRRISLNAIVDRERDCVQIIRNLSDTKGFLVDSGNMGWMSIAEFEAFIADSKDRLDSGPGCLYRALTTKK